MTPNVLLNLIVEGTIKNRKDKEMEITMWNTPHSKTGWNLDRGESHTEDLFRLEVNTGSGGYGFTDTLSELTKDVENEYGDEVKAEVEVWALNSKEMDEFQKYGMRITNIGRWMWRVVCEYG